MTGITIGKIRRNERNRKLNGGTVDQQKIAALKVLELEFAKTDEIWIKNILRRVGRCVNTHRCNSKWCPTCSNPRLSMAKRKKERNVDLISILPSRRKTRTTKSTKKKATLTRVMDCTYAICTTKNAKSGEYRVDSGQRMIGPFVGLPLAMMHCATINLKLVSLDGNLKREAETQRLKLRRVFKKLSLGAIARGKFDHVIKYADELAFDLSDEDMPRRVTNDNLPHQRYTMLHIHFIVFDPWMSRIDIRNLFAEEFPGAKRICFKQARAHTVLPDGTMLGGAQGYLEYFSMEKVEVPFGNEADLAIVEFARIDNTWKRSNRNFSFGKSIAETGIVIDLKRVDYLEKGNRLAWIKRNWSKLCYAERFIHLWFSSGSDMIAGIKPMPNYRQVFKDQFIFVFDQYCNWLKGDSFEAIDFVGFLNLTLSALSVKQRKIQLQV